jgi:hypothetical protein
VALPPSIGATGSAEVQLSATRAGAPVAGLTATLAASLGRLDRAQLTTDAQGRAITRLRGEGVAGVAMLTAQAPTAANVATAELRIGLDRTLALSAQPASIAGSETAAVTVIVFEPSGATAPAGIAVTLTTSRGRLADLQPRTDAQGVARTTLATDGQAGTARLTATLAGASDATDVLLRPAYELTLQANPTTIGPAGATALTVRVAALDASLTVRDVTVQLSTTLGRLQQGSLRTDARGVATTTLDADGRTGSAVVTATLVTGGAAPATVTVTVR